MYKQYLEVRDSRNGLGVFAKIQLPAGVPVIEFGGDFFTANTIKHSDDIITQIGPDLFLGPSGKKDDYLNHSCHPNCYLHIVGRRAFLYTRYIIKADTELTFDYSTSSTDTTSDWSMSCNCGANNCRKVISGFQYLSEELKKEYKDKDLLPLFLKEVIFI